MKKIVQLSLLVCFALAQQNASAQWTQIGNDIDGEAASDLSGKAVSISGDGLTIAIGAQRNDDNGSDAGHVRIYKNITGTWTQQGSDIDGEAAGDFSGSSVSLSDDGSTVAIGAPRNTGFAGHVRVYKYITGTWVQQGSDIDGEAANDRFGWSVSLSSDGLTVAIGAKGNDGNGTNSGHVRIYQYSIGAWVQQGTDIDGEAIFNDSGTSVSLSDDGSTVAIGAPRNTGSAGQVRVYKYLTGTWTQQGIDIDGEAANDRSGTSVSLSSDGLTVAIGADGNDAIGNAGHVRVYKYITGTWTQQGVDIDGEAANDNSGISVSLSSDGLTVAIGAEGNDGNGNSAGHVRIYQYTTGTWVQQGSDINGETSADLSGASVSLSSDGLVVVIGAHVNGNAAGHARVYQFSIAPILVSSITVQGQAGATMITTIGGTLQMTANVLPANADDATRTWSVANGTGSASIDANGLLTAISNGTVTVTATANDASGITGTAVITISNQIITSLNEQTAIHNLSIYPNPVKSLLTISSEEQIETIIITNVAGKTVKTFTPSCNTIDVSDLTNGIYFLQIQTDKALINKKFIKE